MQGFDPYHKWLGIPREEQPPDHYRLLGLARFEADPDVIDSAATQRMSHLRGYAAGVHAALAAALLNEVSRARLTLLDFRKKSEYDRRLAASVAPPAPPPQATAQQYTQEAPASTPSPVVRASSSSRTKRRGGGDRRIVVAGHIIAPFVGLAAGYLVLCFIRPSFDVFGIVSHPAPPPAATAIKTKNASAVAASPSTPPTQTEEADPVEGLPPVRRRPPNAPRAPQRPTAQAVIVDLPEAWEPPIFSAGDAQTAVTIGTIKAPANADIRLNVWSPSTASTEYAAEPTGRPHDWLIGIEGTPVKDSPIASVAIKDAKLVFQWLQTDEAHNALRNCVLYMVIEGRPRYVPLRVAVDMPAINVDLEKPFTLTPLPSNPWDPGLGDFATKVLGLDGPGTSVSFRPITGRADGVEPVIVTLDGDTADVQIRVQLVRTGANTSIKVSPFMVDPDGEELPFTKDRVTNLARAVSRQLADAERDLAAAQQGLVATRQNISTLQSRLRRAQPVVRAALSQQISGLQVRESALVRKIAELERELPMRRKQITTLEELVRIGERLYQKTTLRCQVSFSVGGEQVVVAKCAD